MQTETEGGTTRTVTPPASTAARWARVGLWSLPIYALLLSLSTLTHQPDYDTDFAGYANYVTSDVFLASHLVASIGGSALGLIGVVAALAFLVRGPAVRPAIVGAVLTIAGNTLVTAVFGAAAFAQPARGRAYLDGVSEIVAVNEDVYGAALLATVGTGLLLFIGGAIAFGVSISRTDRGLRWAGIGYASLLSLFTVAGFTLQSMQPVMALALVAATVLISVRLPRAVEGPHRAAQTPLRQGRLPACTT